MKTVAVTQFSLEHVSPPQLLRIISLGWPLLCDKGDPFTILYRALSNAGDASGDVLISA